MTEKRRAGLAAAVLLSVLLTGCGPGSTTSGTGETASGSASASGSCPEVPDVSVEIVAPVEFPWYLTLVNRENPLPEDFTVPELTQLRDDREVDSRIWEDLQAMMDAAREEGLEPLICSAFRSRAYQEGLFQEEIQRYLDRGLSPEEAEAEASMWVAVPGTSEHELGLAVDIVDVNYQILDEAQEQTEVQQWLLQHCAEYGFILRYPTDRSAVTGIDYEPWHYRYVGRPAARAITDSGLCLEEYLEQITAPEQIPPI